MNHNGTMVMRSRLEALCIASLVALGSPHVSQAGDLAAVAAAEDVAATPLGDWTTIDDDTGKARSVVRIYEHEGKLRGKIIELLENPNAKCDECKGRNKGRPILGMIIMWDMQRDGDKWSGGKVFDPEKGKTYRAKMWLEGESSLKLRGYAGPFFRTQVWRRAQ